MTVKKTAFMCWFLIFCLFSLGIFIQSVLYCNSDVSWLLHATQKFINGGHYYKDFFETNPPMILYLSAPSVLLAKLFHVSLSFSFYACVFLMAIVSFFLCYSLLQKIFEDNYKFKPYLLLVTLIFIFILLPVYTFGEREHLTLILIMPYLFLVTLRLKNKLINRYCLLLVGLLAGIGFAIKPHFLIPLMFVELYLMTKKKDLLSWVRPESLFILAILVSYFISIFIITPEYIDKIVPLASKLYFATIDVSLSEVLTQSFVFFLLVTAGFYFLLRDKIYNKEFANVLFIVALGFFLVYVLQHAPWYYHALPMVGVLTLLMMLLFQENILMRGAAFLAISISFFVILFSVVIPAGFLRTVLNHEKSQPVIKLVRLLNRNCDNCKIYVFSTSIATTYPLVDYVKAVSASRFPSHLLLPGLLRLSKAPQGKVSLERLGDMRREIVDIVIADLQKNKPKLIIVDVSKEKPLSFNLDFDYIKFFSQDLRFREIFSHYGYLDKIANLVVYKLYGIKDGK